MAIERKNAEAMVKDLKQIFCSSEIKVEIRGPQNEVVLTAKSATLQSSKVAALSKCQRGHSISFGRSGANFRMTIW